MITIINKFTGEVITKYSGALVGESTEDSFIANAKGSGTFRGRWNAIVENIHSSERLECNTMPS